MDLSPICFPIDWSLLRFSVDILLEQATLPVPDFSDMGELRWQQECLCFCISTVLVFFQIKYLMKIKSSCSQIAYH